MVRSAAAVLAVLILPTFALAQAPTQAAPSQQEPVGTHTVVGDDTLWDLAQFYYQNPFEWRVIWEANRDSIADPNLIFPSEVFVIPGLPGTATAQGPTQPDSAMVVGLPETEPEDIEAVGTDGADLVQFGFRQARPAQQVRSIFWADTASTGEPAAGARAGSFYAVTRDAVYSAPWVVPFETEPEHSGVIDGFAFEGARASTIRSFDRVRMTMPSPARVGAELQIFRVVRTIESVGQVVIPTGVLTVSAIVSDGVIGVVTKEYQRIQPGDYVRPAPSYTLERGVTAQAISGGSEAMIMGFAGRQVLNDLGHIAFLDLGSDDGVTVGDEFVLYGEATADSPRGVLQVVGTTETMSSARITFMTDNVFRQGVIVRLVRKMP
jgi:nucleoid-associated protein YgaU